MYVTALATVDVNILQCSCSGSFAIDETIKYGNYDNAVLGKSMLLRACM